MSKIIAINFILLMPLFMLGQNLGNFESFNLEPATFLNGSNGISVFESGPIILNNHYNPDWQSWSGWAISNVTDNSTPGFSNQYRSIAGKGAEASEHYSIAYAPSTLSAVAVSPLTTFDGLYISNNTYTYFSMLNGDSFAKKFGGESGNDPDFLFVTIKAYVGGIISPDSIDFYLADYRFEDGEEDYILDHWGFIDLQQFGAIDSLLFTLSSSDVGSFGMNTPAYFCMDQIYSKLPNRLGKTDIDSMNWKAYPTLN